MSINVGPEIEGKHDCELNNVVDESPSHSALEKKWGYTHYSVEVCLAAVLLTSYFFLVSYDYCDDGGNNDDANDDDDDDNDDCEYCFEIRKVQSYGIKLLQCILATTS